MSAKTRMWKLSEAAEAIGIPVATPRSWVQRGHIRFDGEDVYSTTIGLPHVISFASVVRLAVTVRLTQLFNMGPDRAWRIAGAFSHSGTGGSGWVGNADLAPTRLPSEVYQSGQTILAFYADRDQGQVLNLQPFTPFGEIADTPFGMPVGLVDVGEIHDRIFHTLIAIGQRRNTRAPRRMKEVA